MKASFEFIAAQADASWIFFQRDAQAQLPFNWHYHPEYELSLVLDAQGNRYIGDHIGRCDGADLVLTGPNLPHTWAVHALAEQKITVRVVWFTHEWLSALCVLCPEFQVVLRWLPDAARGLQFSDRTLSEVRPLMEAMVTATPMARLILLLQVLQLLIQDQPVQLSSAAFTGLRSQHSEERLNKVIDYLTQNYQQALNLAHLAALANLTENSLCRAFRKHTRASISEYLLQLRIGSTCARLIDTDEPIARIAEESGFANLSHFNRQFKAKKGMTPSEFRLKHHIE